MRWQHRAQSSGQARTTAHVSCEILNLRCNMDCERQESFPARSWAQILMSPWTDPAPHPAARSLVSIGSRTTGKYRTVVRSRVQAQESEERGEDNMGRDARSLIM